MPRYCLLTILRRCKLISPWLIFSTVTLISNLLQPPPCLSSPLSSRGAVAPATENQGQQTEEMTQGSRQTGHGQREGYSG